MKMVLMLFIISIPNSSFAFDKYEQAVICAISTVNLIDVVQTHRMTTGNYEEVNLITKRVLGERVPYYKMLPYKTLIIGPILYFIDTQIQNDAFRKLLLFTCLLASVNPVIKNENVKDSGNNIETRFSFNF